MAREIKYVATMVFCQPVKPNITEATYENGLLRIEVFFKDSMADSAKVAIKEGGEETNTKSIEA